MNVKPSEIVLEKQVLAALIQASDTEEQFMRDAFFHASLVTFVRTLPSMVKRLAVDAVRFNNTIDAQIEKAAKS